MTEERLQEFKNLVLKHYSYRFPDDTSALKSAQGFLTSLEAILKFYSEKNLALDTGGKKRND